MLRIGVVVGSLRQKSIHAKLARVVAKLLPDRLDLTIIPIKDIPIYNEDLWEYPPESVINFKREITFSDGILILSPEYNRSVTPALKNALDWGTRPQGNNSWQGKPCGVIGAAPGAIGTAAAQTHLRSILPIIGMSILPSSEVYLNWKDESYDDDDNIVDEKTQQFLQSYMVRFADWVEKQIA